MWPSSCNATTAVSTEASTKPPRLSPKNGHRIRADSAAKPSWVMGRSKRKRRVTAPVSPHSFSFVSSRRMAKIAEDEEGKAAIAVGAAHGDDRRVAFVGEHRRLAIIRP